MNKSLFFLIVVIISLFTSIVIKSHYLPFYADEVHTFSVTSDSFSSLYGFLVKDITAPIYFFFMVILAKMFGSLAEPEFLYRIPSFFAGILSIFFFYRVGRFWLSKEESFLSTFLFSISYILVNFSAYGRFYTLILLFSLISLYSLEKFIESSRQKWLFIFFIISCVNFYTHYYAIVFFTAQVAYFLTVDFLIKNRNKANTCKKKEFILGALLSIFVMLLLFPLILKQSGNLMTQSGLTDWFMWRLRSIGSGFYMFASTRNHQAVQFLSIALWIIALLGFINFFRTEKRRVIILCLSSIFCFIISLIAPTRSMGSRYFIVFFPLFIYCLTFGISSIKNYIGSPYEKVFRIIVLLIVITPSLFNIYIFTFVQDSPFETLNHRLFADKFKDSLIHKPVLFTNYGQYYKGGRTHLQGASIARYLYENKMAPRKFWAEKVFSSRKILSEIEKKQNSVESKNPIICAFYSDGNPLKLPPEDSWIHFTKNLYIKAWPPMTAPQKILKEAETIGFPANLGNF